MSDDPIKVTESEPVGFRRVDDQIFLVSDDGVETPISQEAADNIANYRVAEGLPELPYL